MEECGISVMMKPARGVRLTLPEIPVHKKLVSNKLFFVVTVKKTVFFIQVDRGADVWMDESDLCQPKQTELNKSTLWKHPFRVHIQVCSDPFILDYRVKIKSDLGSS